MNANYNKFHSKHGELVCVIPERLKRVYKNKIKNGWYKYTDKFKDDNKKINVNVKIRVLFSDKIKWSIFTIPSKYFNNNYFNKHRNEFHMIDGCSKCILCTAEQLKAYLYKMSLH